MPREFTRSQRMAEQLRRVLAEIVHDEIKDPRVGFLSFTEVRMSRDLSHAIIYTSVLEADKQNESIEILNRATSFIRKSVAQRIRARIVPTLKFVLDESISRGALMDNIIEKALNKDKNLNQEQAIKNLSKVDKSTLKTSTKEPVVDEQNNKREP